ncbi:MAG: hypothetical protein HYS70_01720 [Nitrospinae bacterium]|nr:hypothetical protein [Nitrospinota bacterium]
MKGHVGLLEEYASEVETELQEEGEVKAERRINSLWDYLFLAEALAIFATLVASLVSLVLRS